MGRDIFLASKIPKSGADSTPLTVCVSKVFITVLLARSMTTYHPASSSSHADCRYELQRLDVGHHKQRSSKCSRRAVRSTGAPHGVPVLIANASDSIAWSLSKTACMVVIETRSVFIGQVRLNNRDPMTSDASLAPRPCQRTNMDRMARSAESHGAHG